MLGLRILILLCVLSILCESLKILGLFSHMGKSHHDVFVPLIRGLSEKGHQVTVVSFFPQKTTNPNIRAVDLSNITMIGLEIISFEMLMASRLFLYQAPKMIDDFARITCEAALASPQLRSFLKEDLNYDIVLVEFFNSNCFMTIAEKVENAPIVALSSSAIIAFWDDHFATPNNPSYIPVIFMDYSEQMTFFERVENTLVLLYSKAYFQFVMNPAIQSIVDRYVENASSVAELSKNVSLMLVNTHWCHSQSKPLVPNIIEIGGMHLSTLKPLSQNIEKWINESRDGVIYFSMGSMIKGHTFPEDKRQMFLRVFERLPQRVLWKWESENMPGKPDNVMIQRWMPQFDILCHPNVKVFISHGGMLGTTETVHCGVPALVMPQFGDQFTNARALEASGGGLVFDFWRGDEETLYQALKKLLDPSFKKQAEQLSARFRDRPLPPLETAIYWVEYVARHGGAHHMRTAAVGMPLYKYLLLDVVAFLVFVLLSFLFITYKLSKFVIRKVIGRSAKVKTN